MNQTKTPTKRAIKITFMLSPFTEVKRFTKISNKPSVPWAVDEWGALWRGINGEWSRMIPTNGLNGEDMRGATHGPFARH